MSGHPKHGSAGSPQNSSPHKAPPSKQQGAKKTKELRADFLLNFQRPPAHQRPAAYGPPQRRSGRPSGKQYRAPTAFVRGRFVQSSFRLFVDAPSPDVLEASFSSDALIDWPNVRSVDLLCNVDEHPKCPICLEQGLVVPKITRCGHIFCLPCIMRYFMMLQGQNLRHNQRCPVCNEQVSPEDLTSVRFQMTRALREDERFSFVLVHREASSISVRGSAAAAMAVAPPSHADEFDLSDADEGLAEAFRKLPSESEPGWHFSRVVRLLPGEHGASLARQVEALRLYRPAAIRSGDTELLPSIDAAVALLEQQMPEGALARLAEQPPLEATGNPWGCCYVEVATGAATQGKASGAAASSTDEAELEYDGAAAGPDDGDDLGLAGESPCGSSAASPVQGAASSPALTGGSPGFESPAMAALPDPVQPAAEQRPGAVDRGGARIISLYQAVDGRLVFLQPFFTKLLLHEHGGRWDRLPAVLPELRLERLHELTVTEEVRRRYRFLEHLPLGSPAWFAEVDLRGQLSKETREFFTEDFAKRRQQKLKDKAKSRREERHSKQMAAVEEERFYQSLNMRHPSVIVAPPTKEDFALDLQGRAVEEPAPGEGADAEAEEDWETGPTLADKLKMKKIAGKVKKPEAAPPPGAASFPALGGAARGSNATTSTWGTKLAASSRPQPAAGTSSGAGTEGPMDGGWDAEEEPTLGEALEAALLKRTSQQTPAETDESAEPAAASSGGKKKKGKPVKIKLFG